MNSIHALFLTLKLDLFKDYLKKKLAQIYFNELKHVPFLELPIVDKRKTCTTFVCY